MNFFAHSLGCKVNNYEVAAITKSLIEEGHKASSLEEADLIVLNTCSVTGQADQKSRQHIRRFRRANEHACLLVMGCYSEAAGEECLSFGADIVLGTSMRNEAIPAWHRYLETKEKIVLIKKNVRHEQYEELGFVLNTEMTRAYLKVQDGCDNFCSYCIIPSLRGNSRSRNRESVTLEAKELVNRGYQEIILTGIHIGHYGADLEPKCTISDLIKDILDAVPSLKRLRISSIEETEINNDEFLGLLRDYPQVASHLHIPLQSGSSGVLKRMRRKYDTESFLTLLDKIRAIRPDIAITTDIIVGFPEESEEEFLETLEFCNKAKFSEIHVFPFSARKGTWAAAVKNQVDPQVKKDRVHRLLEISKRDRKAYEERFYGQTLDVLFEDYDETKKIAYGHTSNYLKVKLPSKRSLHGEILPVDYNEESAAD